MLFCRAWHADAQAGRRDHEPPPSPHRPHRRPRPPPVQTRPQALPQASPHLQSRPELPGLPVPRPLLHHVHLGLNALPGIEGHPVVLPVVHLRGQRAMPGPKERAQSGGAPLQGWAAGVCGQQVGCLGPGWDPDPVPGAGPSRGRAQRPVGGAPGAPGSPRSGGAQPRPLAAPQDCPPEHQHEESWEETLRGDAGDADRQEGPPASQVSARTRGELQAGGEGAGLAEGPWEPCPHRAPSHCQPAGVPLRTPGGSQLTQGAPREATWPPAQRVLGTGKSGGMLAGSQPQNPTTGTCKFLTPRHLENLHPDLVPRL